MQFIPLDSDKQLAKISETEENSIIFKHNTTCPISKSVRKRLEQDEDQLPENTSAFVLDLLAHRDLSDAIESTFGVTHQSPQILVIRKGRCIYNQSSYAISVDEVRQALEETDN